MPRAFIPVTGPSITTKEVEYVARAARDGWNKNYLKYVTLFEEKFARYVGRKYALATSSCTGALHLAYLALGLKKGDEVLVPDITWVATVEPLYYIGARPVFVDVEPDTWCLDPAKLEKAITKRTKAIVVVDLYGHVADMKPILAIARKHKLKVVEDAAEAVGSEYYGKRAGGFGDVSCFSFHGSKALVTGEGGMLLTDDEDLIKKARFYNDHCKDSKKMFWTLDIGYKYKMSNFQASCGLAQLERVRGLIATKRRIFSWYKKYLAKIPGLQFNVEHSHTKNSYWMVGVVLGRQYRITKEKLMEELMKKYRIQIRPFFYPLSTMPATKQKSDTPIALDVSERGINLPCAVFLSEKDVAYVCASLVHVLRALESRSV